MKEIHKALFEVQQKAQVVSKSGVNQHMKNSYSTISDVLASIKAEITKQKLLLTQKPSFKDGVVNLTTVITHIDSNESLTDEMHMPIGDKLTPQAFGSAITYARRYHLISLFCLASEDDDGALSSALKLSSQLDTLESFDNFEDMKEAYAKFWSSANRKDKIELEAKYNKLKAELQKDSPPEEKQGFKAPPKDAQPQQDDVEY